VKERILELLRCPACGGRLQLEKAVVEEGEVREGQLVSGDCGAAYSIRNFIPRFVGDDNYARGFGFQWNRHARTLVDKFNGTTITTDRFYAGTQWQRADLAGKRILEAGCGAGRFTEVMLEAGMEVFSLDYSNAVDACLANHGLQPNLHLIQGNIYALPFAPGGFDRVFCFGVLQHTPDVKKSFLCLAAQLRPGGRIAVDVYPRTFRTLLHYPRYLLRPFAKRLPAPVLYSLVCGMVRVFLPLSIALKRIPLVGRYLFPLLPVANYWGTFPLDRHLLREWSIIDTFDWLACWYDQPQRASTLEAWLQETGLTDRKVHRLGSFVGLGERPAPAPG
jgi:SAM-dependent methyltransferase